MLKAGAVQWEVLSQQSTSSESNQRDRKSRGRLQAVGVILKWLHAKCSGIDGFKFRPQRPQNDKVRGRGGVRKPLFSEIPIIWLFKFNRPPLTAPLTALRGLHTIIPLTTWVLAPNTAERGGGHEKGVPDLEHTLSITQCNMETWLWVIVSRRRALSKGPFTQDKENKSAFPLSLSFPQGRSVTWEPRIWILQLFFFLRALCWSRKDLGNLPFCCKWGGWVGGCSPFDSSQLIIL